ncbi:MAG: hypothetical protein AAGI49_05325, partial [Bacteroidota bacterium]
MQKTFSIIGLIVLLTISFQLNAQYTQQDSTYKKCFVGSTLFVLYNLVPDDNPPDFAQLNFGYRLTGRDVISLELKTWKYAWSLGIPYGSSFEAPEEKFPGYIREFGIALAYQRFLWKGLYAGVHSMSAWQNFVKEDGDKIDDGFQIFNTYRLGYHVKLWNDKFFIQPSIAVTHRLFHTEMPASFKVLDDQWG